MSRPRPVLASVVLSVFLLSGWGVSASAGSSGAPVSQRATFQTTSCPFTVTGGVFAASHVRCGYLVVPENRQRADSRTIKVAVAIFEATQPDPAPDPLVYLVGGPGGTIVASWGASIIANGLHLDFVGNRDLILVDQRGTGLSQPQLACPELSHAGWQALDQHLSDSATAQLEYGALRACRARLVKAGIDLSAYNTVENAADIAALREALGYKEVDLYGGSYGATLALQVMRDHPEGIRSVVMDAIADPLFDVYNDFIPSTWNALHRVFTECATSPSCSTAHPHLRQTFLRAVTRLQAHPVVWQVYSPQTKRSYPLKQTGGTFVYALHGALDDFQSIPLIPELIDEVAVGHGRLLDQAKQAASLSTNPSRVGMFLSMECSQDQSRASAASIAASAQAVPASIRPAFISYLGMAAAIDDLTQHGDPLTECRIWHVPGLAPVNYTYFHSAIPTLLLPGAFDANTRPERMPALAAHLGHAYLVPFPTYGHGAVGNGACPNSIVLDFLTHPNRKPDTSCVAQLTLAWQ